jgi:preprotein translocase subunit SecE
MRAVKEVSQKMGTGALAMEAGGTLERLSSYPRRLRQFFHDVRLEMRNVTWPTWNDVKSTTFVVVVATFFFGFYLGLALDVPLARVVSWLLTAAKGLLS